MLITDQKTLAKLVLSLRVDIDFLLKSIEVDPDCTDERSRSQFLEGVLHFLKEATDLTGDTVRSHLLFSDTHFIKELARPESAPLPSLSHNHTHLRRSQSMNFPPILESSRVGPHYNFIPISERHSLWFPNAPSSATPELLANQIFGGPLESLRRYRYEFDEGSGYLINFFDHETASAFLTYSNSLVSQITFPGVEEGWRPRITWSENPNTIKRYVIEAVEDLVNPARRGLVIKDFPVNSVGKAGLRQRIIALDEQYAVGIVVHVYEVLLAENIAYLLFEQIRHAMKVMEWWQSGLLGPELNGCNFLYERDPSERPFPEVEEGLRPEIIDNQTSQPIAPPIAPTTLLSDSLPTALPAPIPESNKLVDVPEWISRISRSPSIASLVGRVTGVLDRGFPPQTPPITLPEPLFDPYWDSAVVDVPGWNSPPPLLPTPLPPRSPSIAYSTDILIDINSASTPPSIASSIDLLLDIADSPYHSRDTSPTEILPDIPYQLSPPPSTSISIASVVNPAASILDCVPQSQSSSLTTTTSIDFTALAKPSLEEVPKCPIKAHVFVSETLTGTGDFSDSFFSTDWENNM